jgi:signal peptidase I
MKLTNTKWKGLSVLTASSSPIVVVLSGSMEPAFQRGDLLFLWARSPRVEIGEVVVCKFELALGIEAQFSNCNARQRSRERYSHCAPCCQDVP